MIRNVSTKARFFAPSTYVDKFQAGAPLFRNITLSKRCLSRNKPLFPAQARCKSHRYFSAATFQLSPSLNDTIYAISTATGRAAIAVVRVSGSQCLEVYKALCPDKSPPKPRTAIVRTLFDPADNQNIVDSSALILYFPAPNTVTGEDILELHIHGGPATQKAIISAIAQYAKRTRAPIRYAEPGEFTRRAFQNNKLDLGQVEALSDALSAETEQQRRAAVRGYSRRLGQTYEEWREQLLYARGELEALIDFSEDQHFDESPAELLTNVSVQVDTMLAAIARHESGSHRGELLKRGIRISLLGPPNAGKSSLLNQLVGREASIVSKEAGTTRDIVEVSLDIRGYLCTFADTAGLRIESDVESTTIIGTIEQEGIRRAKVKATESDVIIAMASIEPSGEDWKIRYDSESLSIASKAKDALIVINKCDTAPQETVIALIQEFKAAIAPLFPTLPRIIDISCHQACGLEAATSDPGNINYLTTNIVEIFKSMTELPVEYEDLIGVTERQRQLLSSCAEYLLAFKREAQAKDEDEADIVIAAEHLRAAAACFSRITGRGDAGDVEEILGVVFEKFCVGK